MKRILFILAVVAAVSTAAWLIWRTSPAEPVSAAVALPRLQGQENKPVEGWVVCKDLGVGPVPGLANPRQRVRLCHPAGWEVDTYCLRADLPVPPIGGTCTRINDDTYNCGNGLQPLKEYNIRETPIPPATNTPTATSTATQSATPTSTTIRTPTPTSTLPTPPTETPLPTPAPTRRPSPGGPGYRQLFQQALGYLLQFSTPLASIEPTPTPFRPFHPTAVPQFALLAPQSPAYPTALPLASTNSLLSDQGRLQIRIKPDSQRLNSGNQIQIGVRVSDDCQFGEGTACVNSYQDTQGYEITFITIHSGIGGEAQGLRHILEGTGLDQAGLPLRQVRKNLAALLGSKVKISGSIEGETFEIIAAVRLPANQVRDYIKLPVSEALAFAAQVNPDLLPYVHPNHPLIVLETCGWRMPGEPNNDGLPDTSASIYLLVIGQSPSHQ